MLKELKQDASVYENPWLTQGFWVMIVYRFGQWRYGIQNSLIRKFFSLIYKVIYKFIQIITKIELPCEASIGKGLQIKYFGGIVVSGYAVIGENCTLYPGVTIGLRHVTEPVAPTIGNNVLIKSGAKIIGKVIVGDGAIIEANTVVLKDVPSGAYVIGVPGKVVE